MNQICPLIKFIAFSISLTLFCVARCSYASEAHETKVDFNIPALALEDALLSYSRQSGLGVIADSRILSSNEVSALNGRYTRLEALRILLRGTGLTFEVRDEANYLVIRRDRRSKKTIEPAVAVNPRALDLEEVVVTAALGRASKMTSSVSVSDIKPEAIADFSPRSEAEVLLMIPGIWAENTGGSGGNSNITVRGLPIAAGGSKYVQLQEDGLPVVLFGDIAFGNNDFWLRYDNTVASVQAIRGGSAGTLASQAPGAVINYISKSGEVAGGSMALTEGLDYDETRVDFDYGAPLSDTWRFHIGGFYRVGEGPRKASWDLLGGYQIKANLTKDFNAGNGYVRLYLKHLDDRAPTYTGYPQTARLSGNKVKDFGSFPGFDARKDTNISKHFRRFLAVNSSGETLVGRMDGIQSDVTGLGVELSRDLSAKWSLENRFRRNAISGIFAAPFMNLTPFEDFISSYSVSTVDGTTYQAAQARYANGPLAGQIVTVENLANPFVNTNAVLFTDMHDIGNYVNDLYLNGTYEMDKAIFRTRFGYYRSGQNIEMDWHFNGSISEARGGDPAMIDLFDEKGNRLTDTGLTGYNDYLNCCARNYNLEYTTDAYYVALNYHSGPVNLDISVRHEDFAASGFFAPHGPQQARDVNGDGVLSIAEQNVYRADIEHALPVNYHLNWNSWSVGANYLITDDLGIFGRASKGHRATADRLVEVRDNWEDDSGALTAQGRRSALSEVSQKEFGIKFRGDFAGSDFALFATLFHSDVDEFSTDLTVGSGGLKTQRYETFGLELESTLNIGENFTVYGNATYTDAEIVKDEVDENEGNIPRATPDWMYLVAPTYTFARCMFGFSLRGMTDTFSSDSNGLKIEGEYFVNAFARFDVLKDLQLSVNFNNLLDNFGQAGRLDQTDPAEVANFGALIGAEAAVSNRPHLGRTGSISLSYRF